MLGSKENSGVGKRDTRASLVYIHPQMVIYIQIWPDICICPYIYLFYPPFVYILIFKFSSVDKLIFEYNLSNPRKASNFYSGPNQKKPTILRLGLASN
uniref:Uncharacterized protein n=1 Tax=Meloidogyne enterolobii TaxID=390850 RepID=A0A6V7V4Y8_MELEN|nr:unnamed protein product [Meloidogyne enterolobii]